MSYYIDLINSTWAIDPKKENLALRAIKALKEYGDSPLVPQSVKTLDQALQTLAFEVDRFPSCDGENVEMLHIVGYNGRDDFTEDTLKAIAPFSVGGSEIEWVGEDHSHWKHAIARGKLVTKYGRVVYDD